MIIVTGAGGFVGSNIAEYISNAGYRVLGTYYNRKPVVLQEDNVIQVDLANWDDVRKKLCEGTAEKIEAVLHFAAQMIGPNMEEYLENTVQSTRNLLRLAQERNVKSFVYASSIAVYGMTEEIVNETSDRTNLSDYGTAKYICERLLQDSAIENRIAIRMPRMLGKRADMTCPWLPKLTQALLDGDAISYFNPEMLYNNLAHCDTLAGFILKLLEKEQLGYQVIGIGASEPKKIIEIVERLKTLTKSKSQLIERKPTGRNTCFLIDIKKAVSMGYEPMSVDVTLERFVNDIKEQ